MARYDTTRRTSSVKPACGSVKHLLFLLIGFLLGYMAATFYHLNEVAEWFSTHVFLQKTTKATSLEKSAEIPKPKFEFYTLLTQENRASTVVIDKVATQPKQDPAAIGLGAPVGTAELRPSSRELLVAERHEASEDLPMEMTAPSSAASLAQQEKKTIETALTHVNTRDGYWVQLASFRRPQDAEKMKAKLSLKGITVSVVSVTQQHLQWFRVVSGPFANKFDAERARNAIRFSARIEGIVRKMDA